MIWCRWEEWVLAGVHTSLLHGRHENIRSSECPTKRGLWLPHETPVGSLRCWVSAVNCVETRTSARLGLARGRKVPQACCVTSTHPARQSLHLASQDEEWSQSQDVCKAAVHKAKCKGTLLQAMSAQAKSRSQGLVLAPVNQLWTEEAACRFTSGIAIRVGPAVPFITVGQACPSLSGQVGNSSFNTSI